MEKTQFEAAVLKAVAAESQNAHKWKPLERLFAAESLRGSGALVNEDRQLGNRAQQLFDGTRMHAGFDTRGFNKHSVFVLNLDSAAGLVGNPDALYTKWIPEIKRNRPATLPPDQSADSVLFYRVDPSSGSPQLVPLALLEWASSSTTQQYQDWYPGLHVETLSSTAPDAGTSVVVAPPSGTAAVPADDDPRNVIYAGPPGVGKSLTVKEATTGYSAYRVTFQPETSYAQFIGEYKVVVGQDPSSAITGYDGQTRSKPVTYYAFEPGVLVQAFVAAMKNPDVPVVVIIEEINRGDGAAIFGDFFQLLDRDAHGVSEFPIHVMPALAQYLHSVGALADPSLPVAFPRNLFLCATMNTSDQSLYPMDAAFKRRWDWRTIPVMQSAEQLKDVLVENAGDAVPLRWIDLVSMLNDHIMRYSSEDKRIGPWFIRPVGGVITSQKVRENLLYHLWHDVLRTHRRDLFDASLRTFDAVQSRFDEGGLKAVIPAVFEQREENAAAAELQTAPDVPPVAGSESGA